MKVAIQGELASFHDVAAKQWFGEEVVTVSCDSFSEVFGALNRHDSDACVVAIENSLYGGINQVYDLIESHGYPIIGEVHLPIHQQLIALPDHDKITHIYSHPVALAQCEAFLDSNYPDAKRVEFPDTAGAVRFIGQQQNPNFAAIASKAASDIYGLTVINENIEDNPANFTRFLVLQPNGIAPKDANRTSLVLTTNHTPGALAKILSILAEQGINLSKLQSRPIIGKPWHYKFYLVLDAAGPDLGATISEMRKYTESLKVLGQYRSQLL